LPEDLVKEIRKTLERSSSAKRSRRNGKYEKTIG
jgi:hypothetical protein